VAVVTGAGSGLGREIALALAAVPFRVVLAGRRREALEETCAALGGAGQVVVADVTREDSVRALFAAALERCGRVDLLVNNAGILGPTVAIDELALDDWEAVLATNLTGAFLCSREALRVMGAQSPPGGRIINNGSLSAQVPRPLAVAYTVAKHGITGLTKATALEGRGRGVACGQIDVGNAATAMTGALAAGARQADGRVAPEPTMEARHVAEAVRYMATLPLEANVPRMTVMATAMPFTGRG
jgi:NAD(P)-dependent dehydrogenase (short-subunit alcohol dehydrogenase family)